MEIWISSLNRCNNQSNLESYNILNDWKEIQQEITNIDTKIKWKPRFALYSCFSGGLC